MVILRPSKCSIGTNIVNLLILVIVDVCLFYGGHECTLLIEEYQSNKRNHFSHGVNCSRS
jgi:hypothetical protein